MAPNEMENFKPDIYGTFLAKLIRNRRGLEEYLKKRKDMSVFISEKNTAELELPDEQPQRGFDLIITSPPYGDAHTTVAYGQFSRLSAEWIGLPNAREVDRKSMGGRKLEKTFDLGPIEQPLNKIRDVDEKRAKEVAAFYIELGHSIETISSLMSENAKICYVIGNRRVKGVTLQTDEFIIYTFSKHGFKHERTIVRNIPNKRMPSKNSPTNVAGKTEVTMLEENIVICQR